MNEHLFDIINFYGLRNQLKQLYSEVYDLTEAVLECEDQIEDNDKVTTWIPYIDQVTNEIADIQVLLEEFKQFFGISDNTVKYKMIYKIQREIERMKEDNE